MSINVIGVTGKKEHGKDEVCGVLQKIYTTHLRTVVRIAFADALYEEVSKAVGIPVEKIRANKKKFRAIMQWWGTEYRREMFGINYWIDQWAKKAILSRDKSLVVVPDVRFLNEAEAIYKIGGTLLRVVRPGHTHIVDAHQSEAEMDSIKADRTILNEGTLKDLETNVILAMRSLTH